MALASRIRGGQCCRRLRAGQPSLWLGRLALTDFRNYGHGELAVDRRPVVLTGPNGAGKTNLLEAISFLVPGRGLRQARLSEVDRVVGRGRGGARRAAGGTRSAVTAEAQSRSAPAAIPARLPTPGATAGW